jgi:hypothetical protein
LLFYRWTLPCMQYRFLLSKQQYFFLWA